MKYKDYIEAKRAIDALKRLPTQNTAPEGYMPSLRRLLIDKLQISALQLSDKPIYRARKNKPGRLFISADELKHPASSPSKGRMNDVGEAFFYGGICELGTIYEMVPALGSLFTISTATKRRGTPIFLIAGLIDDPLCPSPQSKTEEIIYNYLNEELTKVTTNPNDYSSTVAISRLLLSKGINAHDDMFLAGLVYPSAQRARGVANVRTYNIGMPGKIFDENFSITGATVYCLTAETNAYQLNEVNRGEASEDGTINWVHGFPEMQQRMRAGLTVDGMLVDSLRQYADEI